ncbi:MAG: PIN domain-containing protein [Thermodesulfovibrionales bacterium]
MYVVDTNVFIQLGFYYPSQFPTIWDRIDKLARNGTILSVREVKNELELGNASTYIAEWVKANRNIFRTPNEEELSIVKDILSDHRFRGLIRRASILKGLPVADPFIIAAAKVHNGMVVTQENYKPDAARIPTVCEVLKVRCINLEQFLKREKLQY